MIFFASHNVAKEHHNIKGGYMEDLKESIQKSKYRTQERFSIATGIHESLISKYVRGLRKPSKNHKKIIEKLLSDDNK
jgi:hypothetical protein